MTRPAGGPPEAESPDGARFSGMTTKEEHEDAALEALRDELVSRGHAAKIIAQPDRDSLHPLTVDALIVIDDVEWAIDHCLLSGSVDLPAARAEADRALSDRLETLAQTHHCTIFVRLMPQTGETGTCWGSDYYDRIVAAVERALTVSTMHASGPSDTDGQVTIDIVQNDAPAVVLQYASNLDGNISIGAQLDAGLRAPLLKKLDGQLQTAKQRGWPTALLLDQHPRPDSRSHTIRMAGPSAVAAAAARIVADHSRDNPPVLDQIWLRPAISPHPLMGPSVHFLHAWNHTDRPWQP